MSTELKNAVNRIHHKIQKYRPEDLLFRSIDLLNRPDSTDIQRMQQYQPWNLLLLIKWVLAKGNYYQPQLRYSVREQDFIEIVNMMSGLGDLVRHPSDYSHVNLFLRNLAYQQFWLPKQELFLYARMARQSIMFGHLDDNSSISKAFQTYTGISIQEFICLSMVLVPAFYPTSRGYVTLEWFQPVSKIYNQRTIERFLDIFTKQLLPARSYLKALEPRSQRDLNFDIYEPSPLGRYPLLLHYGKYFCYFPPLLFQCIETFIYDMLRSRDANRFMGDIGTIFQNYVKRGLDHSRINYVTEDSLKSQLGAEIQVVDFLAFDNETNILIDAKGIEMGYSGIVGYRSGDIRQQIKDSVIKAVRQAYAVAKRIKDKDKLSGHNIGRQGNYLIVVTYKDLYLGTGEDIYHSVAKPEIDKIMAEFDNIEYIPLAQIFVLTIDEFDLLIQCVGNGGKSMATILLNTVRANEQPQARGFLFHQHIFRECPQQSQLPYHDVELQRIINRLETP